MSYSDICNYLKKTFSNIERNDENQSITVEVSDLYKLCEQLYNDEKLDFNYLMCLSAYDNNNDSYGVAYNFYSIKLKHYIEVNVNVKNELKIPSVSELWKTALWHEREAYDMIGIVFEGHPNLERILLPSDWEGHPLRKDYKEPDYYKGVPVPKDKSYWE